MEISIGNSKTGPSFSMPNGKTCPGKTATCTAACYVDFGRMSLPVSVDKRERNLAWWLDVAASGNEWEWMVRDITAAKVKTLRIHDSGDFFSPLYTCSWWQACKSLPLVQFWAYTRSFTIPGILEYLVKLAALSNVAIWLSADQDNWKDALIVLRDHPEFSGIAFMQTEGTEDIARIIQKTVGKTRFINFPTHKAFGHLAIDSIDKKLRNCPAVTKEIACDKKAPACLTCKLCLPGGNQ